MTKILFPIWLLSWAVLLPVTSVNTQVGQNSGLNLFIFGNISQAQQPRYAAHLVMVYLFTGTCPFFAAASIMSFSVILGWILYTIKQEMKHFIVIRQQHLIDSVHAKSVQANTLLITGIPNKYLSQDALYKLFRDLPGGVKKIWINRYVPSSSSSRTLISSRPRNLKELPDIYDRRIAACNKLESAETALMKTAAEIRLAAIKKGGETPAAGDVEAGAPDHVVVPRDQRPTHRLGMLPFTGEKVDTIEWARQEIIVCTELLKEGRAVIENDGKGVTDKSSIEGSDSVGENDAGKETAEVHNYPPMNSAFITFNRQIAANLASQVLVHHEPYRMSTSLCS